MQRAAADPMPGRFGYELFHCEERALLNRGSSSGMTLAKVPGLKAVGCGRKAIQRRKPATSASMTLAGRKSHRCSQRRAWAPRTTMTRAGEYRIVASR